MQGTPLEQDTFFPGKGQPFPASYRTVPEIGGRSSYVVDIPLKMRVLGQNLGLPQNGRLASRCNGASLMESDGTKITCPKTSAVVCNRKFHLLNRRYSSHGFVTRMVCSFIGQFIDFIELFGKEASSVDSVQEFDSRGAE